MPDMEPSSTAMITEFAIVVAGFTGLVFSTGSEVSNLIRFRTATMLFYAFSAAFGSLMPTLFASFGFADIWVASSYVLAGILVANMSATTACSRLMLTADEREQLKGYMWFLVFFGNILFLVWLAALYMGALVGSITGVFIFALIWQLVLSSILFVRLLLAIHK